MTKPLNVLFITADQWRGECLSTLGHSVVKTPNLDSLAADGVLFTSHYAQCSPCGPSRASLLTGMYMMNHRSVRNGTPLDARFTNIALEARRAGYDPALVGYTDTSLDPREYHPDDPALRIGYEGPLPGFQHLVNFLPSCPITWIDYLAAKGYDVPELPFDVFMPENGHRSIGGFGPYGAPARYCAEDSDTAFCADQTMAYIAEQAGRPWFLHLSFLRPHPPYIAPAPYHRLYDPDTVPAFRRAATPEEEARQHPLLAKRVAGWNGVAQLDEREQRQLRATYYATMTEIDDHVGRIVAFLKLNDLYDNTLIVFTSDHGDMLGDHWIVGKECYFDPAFHIPLIVRMPGAKWDGGRGRVVDAFSENVDLMPTILDLIGCDVPVQCDGHSLAPFLDGGTPVRWRDAVHWEYDFRDVDDDSHETEFGIGFEECTLTVIRDHKYKYVHFTGLPPLFFDIANDPGEMNDLAGDPDHAAAVLAYAQKMLSWRMAHADRTLTGIKLTPCGPVELSRNRR